MMSHFPENIMRALVDAVYNVFWKKSEVRALYQKCGVPHTLTNAQDWNDKKIRSLEPVLQSLNSTEDGLGPLRMILAETLKFTSGDHLLWLADGQKRKREAERCLDHLRLLVEKHDAQIEEERKRKDQMRSKRAENEEKGAFERKLGDLKARIYEFHASNAKQERGYGLEAILYELFDLFELEPRGPFRVRGEQIDGAFVLDQFDFLLEAKWQGEPAQLKDLRDLDGAIGTNLDNTLGLFVSMNHFSQEALDRYSQAGRPKLICMNGMDLISVLEGQVDLVDLLRRKRAHAAQTGNVFVSAKDILEGRA